MGLKDDYRVEDENLFDTLQFEDLELTEATIGDIAKNLDAAGAEEEQKTPWYQEADDADLDLAEKRIKYILENPMETSKPGLIEKELDRAYIASKRAQRLGKISEGATNVLFTGPAGTGKTSRIKKWGKNHKPPVNVVHVLCSTMDTTDLGGAITPDQTGEIVKRLASTEMDELGEVENSVLFLDEWNRASKDIRGTLLTLIQDHTIPDPRVRGHQRLLPNFLFTVAAINPAGDDMNTDQLDQAEQTRFGQVEILADRENTYQYLLKSIAEDYDKVLLDDDDDLDPKEKKQWLTELKRKILLVDALFADPNFNLDTQKEMDDLATKTDGALRLTVTSRTLTNLLSSCDGTKKDFLDRWDRFCNPMTKYKAERALASYKDPKFNASNSVFGRSVKTRKGDIDLLDLLD